MNTGFIKVIFSVLAGLLFCLMPAGCDSVAGYSSKSLYPEDVKTVCVDIFDNESFRRGMEFEVTDALKKRIEAQSPYKIVSSRNLADSIITGKLTSVRESILSLERQKGTALEKEVTITAVVNWKNLKTGELILERQPVTASQSYSTLQNQSLAYSTPVAANKLARSIVEKMEKKW